ncbi:MAG: beta-ketoacyl-ACP synthase II [Anaerolineae bacterium]|nr:beta-ketoacyl-ACP synthase II [Anaerolineae bacterium]
MAERVVVTGMGAITPLGLDVPTTWEALVAGRSGVGRITMFDPSPFKTQIAAEIKGFDANNYMDRREARRLDRFTHFAIAAAKEALADAKLDPSQEEPGQVGVLIGSGIGGIYVILQQVEVMREKGPGRIYPLTVPAMLTDTAAGQIAITYGLRGPNFSVSAACATGGVAVGEAYEIILRGDAQVMLAGGTESAIVPLAVAGFDAIGATSTKRIHEPQKACRPFDKDRDGFVLAEGAGVVVLESLSHAQARGARVYAELAGYGNTADAYHLTAPWEDGSGASETMRIALRKAGISPNEVDYINAHGTSTVLNDKSETAAIKAVFGERAYDIPISGTKSMTGHLVGAAGAVEAIVAVKTIETGIIHPTINYEYPDPECDLDYVPNVARRIPQGVRIALSNSFGFGGHNTCLIFRATNGAA